MSADDPEEFVFDLKILYSISTKFKNFMRACIQDTRSSRQSESVTYISLSISAMAPSSNRRQCVSYYNEIYLLLYGFVLSVKCLLIRCYHSTDFEVHRNWMAITYHLPLSQWYCNSVSGWTIDYPPFFAYLEYVLARVAALFDSNMLSVQAESYFSDNVLIFQRFSVIALDITYTLSSWFVSRKLVDSTAWRTKDFRRKVELGLFALLLVNPVLILLDNVHFQYNSFMYSLLFLSIGFLLAKKYLMAALWFSILLNFKHIFLYYVPAFVFFYIHVYLLPLTIDWNTLRRITSLGSVLVTPILVAFAPFLYAGGFDGVSQIIQQLFPFKRGLTHAYWAPNIWSLYNSVDYVGYKTLHTLRRWIGGRDSALLTPQYTRGLVMEYDHVVLSNVTVTATLMLTILFCLPIAAVVRRKDIDAGGKFLASLTLSAFAFFVFGWHVHEKALLMVFMPALLLVFKDLRYFSVFHGLFISTLFSCFPLFFTPLENLLKFGLTGAYLVLYVFVFHRLFRFSRRHLLPTTSAVYGTVLAAVGLYECFLHRAIFGNRAPFLPIAVFSVHCTLGVLNSYIQLLFTLFGQDLYIWWLKRRNNPKLQHQITRHLSPVGSLSVDSVKLLAGVDISTCVDEPSLAVVSLTVINASNLTVVDTADEVILLTLPYIPEYLAVREASALADIINSFVARTKQKFDLLFVDGNGRYHSRQCGLALHVGYLTDTPSVGVAKTFNRFPLRAMGSSEEEKKSLEMKAKEFCRENGPTSCMNIRSAVSNGGGDTNLPVLSVLRRRNNNQPLYISAGFGVSAEAAAVLAARFVADPTTNPIRLSDLRSRALLRFFYDQS